MYVDNRRFRKEEAKHVFWHLKVSVCAVCRLVVSVVAVRTGDWCLAGAGAGASVVSESSLKSAQHRATGHWLACYYNSVT